MRLGDMLRLGDARLYERSAPIVREELPQVVQWAKTLDGIILQYRTKFNAGRAVAAPQMGIFRRLVCVHIDQPVAMINPRLTDLSEEMFELWDDCMCFPGLLVKVRRHLHCTLHFLDLDWQPQVWQLSGAMSELLQHEIDHLDGILATQRAIDDRALKMITPGEQIVR